MQIKMNYIIFEILKIYQTQECVSQLCLAWVSVFPLHAVFQIGFVRDSSHIKSPLQKRVQLLWQGSMSFDVKLPDIPYIGIKTNNLTKYIGGWRGRRRRRRWWRRRRRESRWETSLVNLKQHVLINLVETGSQNAALFAIILPRTLPLLREIARLRDRRGNVFRENHGEPSGIYWNHFYFHEHYNCKLPEDVQNNHYC